MGIFGAAHGCVSAGMRVCGGGVRGANRPPDLKPVTHILQ